MNHSAYLQRKLDRQRQIERLAMPDPSCVLQLQPLQHLAYADNYQMTLYRNDAFMGKVATDPLQLGELNPNMVTWNLLNLSVF